jgi:cytochrome c-type biogenesis protein CcmH/NrfG
VLALGNRLYDARRYAEAVPYYETAVRLDPDNVDASTDLGTALYYSGRPDDALAQYERSLAIDDAHAQTLFNIGIVSFEGLGDARRAIDSWERLLSTNPAYPDRARVEQLLAQARQQGGG